MFLQVVCDHFKNSENSSTICSDNVTLKSHHNMIHSTFSSILDRHMLKPVTNHPDYYFYDLTEKLVCYYFYCNYFNLYLISRYIYIYPVYYYYLYCLIIKLQDYDNDSNDSYYTSNRLSPEDRRKKYLSSILMGKTSHINNYDVYEIDDQDIFPLFVNLVCTVKTNKVTISKSVRSLPTCIRKYLYY